MKSNLRLLKYITKLLGLNLDTFTTTLVIHYLYEGIVLSVPQKLATDVDSHFSASDQYFKMYKTNT